MKTMHQLARQSDRIRDAYLTISGRYDVDSMEEKILNRRYTNAMIAISNRVIKHQYI